MILGGRSLWQELKGEMTGIFFFNGINVTGYDNHSDKYVSVWMDSMSTAILFFKGTELDGKIISLASSYDDPVRGPMRWRSVTRIADENSHVFEMYGTDRTGKEEKMMEITYTRR